MYDEDENEMSTESRYKRLSYQLLGELNCCKGPFIDLNRNSDHVLPQVSKRIRRKKAVKRSSKCSKRKDFARCLICYSDLSQMEFLDNEVTQEKSDHLTEFLRIIRSPISTLNENLNELNDEFEQSVQQLATISSCLCGPCNAACQKLIKVHRHMRKLEQEVKECQVKFLNAVKLSKAIAEKYDIDRAIEKNNHDEYESNEDRQIIAIHKTGLVVDQVRTYLVGGKEVWNSMKDKWLDYVHLDNEFSKNTKRLPKFQKKTKARQRKKDTIGSSKIKSQVLHGDSLVKIIKVEEVILSPIRIEEKESDSVEPEQVEGIEVSSSMADATMKNVPSLDEDNDAVADASFSSENEDGIELECDSTEHGQLKEEKVDAELNESPIDIQGVSKELGPHGEKRKTTTESLVKRKKAYYGPVGFAHPFSFIHKPPPVKPLNRHTIYYRKRRAQHPNMSIREFLRLHKNLPKGRARRPIEELKSTSRNTPSAYSKWRETQHGKTMSIPQYKKMRKELALKQKKVFEEEGVLMPTVNDSIVPVRWVEKDGKLTYLGFEVNKHEDGTMSCASCPDWNFPPSKQRSSMAYHIKKYHVEVVKNFACEKCDAKFLCKSVLNLHEIEKHGGGYQCEICGQTLSNRSSLFQHVRIKHNGIKPHICEHCGKGFGTKKDMTIHVRRHTGERPFVCHVCADTFVDKQSMKKHIRTKHPGEPTDEIYMPQNIIVSKPTAGVEKTSGNEKSSQKSNLGSCSV